MFAVSEVFSKAGSSSNSTDKSEDNTIKLEECNGLNEKEIEEIEAKIEKEEKFKFNLFSRRNIFVLFYLICLTGCCYQMIEVLILYFKFETVTTLTIEKSNKVVPPSMSICFPYISLIKLPLLFQKYPHFLSVAQDIINRTGETIDFETYRIRNYKKTKGKFDWDFGEYIETELSIREILSVTVTLEDMFVQCVLKSPENYTTIDSKNLDDCRKVWDIDYFVKDENKCFLFAFKAIKKRSFVYDSYKLSNHYNYRGMLQQLRIDWKKGLSERMERAYIIFHPRNRFPRGRTDPVLTIRYPAKDASYTISYAKVVSKLMPYPYGSDCKDYTKVGFESRADCVDKCVIDKSNRKYKRVPYNLVFNKDSDLKIFGFKQLDVNQNLVTEFEEDVKECRQVCKNRNCDNENYTPNLLAAEEGTKLKFIIEVPSSLDIHTKLSPKLTLLEYIIYNTSVFGFWFGLCVLQLADFVEYVKKKRRDAMKLKRLIRKKAITKL